MSRGSSPLRPNASASRPARTPLLSVRTTQTTCQRWKLQLRARKPLSPRARSSSFAAPRARRMAKSGRPTRYAASAQCSCARDAMPIAAAQSQQKFWRSEKIHVESVPANVISPLTPLGSEPIGGRYGVTGDQKVDPAAAVLGTMAARTRWTPCRPRAPDASPSSGRDGSPSLGKCCCQVSVLPRKKVRSNIFVPHQI